MWHGPGEEEALAELASQLLQRLDLLLGLDSFGNDVEPEPLADCDDRRREAAVAVMFVCQERAVHLENVDREAG